MFERIFLLTALAHKTLKLIRIIGIYLYVENPIILMSYKINCNENFKLKRIL